MLRPPGSDVARPNTLSDEMAPNTFRPRSQPATPAGSRASRTRIPSTASPEVVRRRRLPGWAIVALIALATVVAIYLLNQTP